LPQQVINKWNEGIKHALADPSFKSHLQKLGTKPGYLGPDEFKRFVKDEYENVKKNAKRLGL
jgi:tripartite-type tricarboxylate transporter receptor subunit TctC